MSVLLHDKIALSGTHRQM